MTRARFIKVQATNFDPPGQVLQVLGGPRASVHHITRPFSAKRRCPMMHVRSVGGSRGYYFEVPYMSGLILLWSDEGVTPTRIFKFIELLKLYSILSKSEYLPSSW
jgi:hypothetical protein